jgi:hypothetical protein
MDSFEKDLLVDSKHFVMQHSMQLLVKLLLVEDLLLVALLVTVVVSLVIAVEKSVRKQRTIKNFTKKNLHIQLNTVVVVVLLVYRLVVQALLVVMQLYIDYIVYDIHYLLSRK